MAFGSLFRRCGWCGVLCALVLAGCTRTYYKAMATFGKEKRDIILVSRVKDSKKEQQAKEQIKTTMEKFQELTGFQGESLEKSYKERAVREGRRE